MMLFDFDEVWADHFVAYSGRRFTAGYPDNEGQWVKGDSIDITFQGMPPQPLDENDLKQLEDGQKVTATEKIYTSYPLRTRSGAQDADRVSYGGVEYEVVKVDTREILGNYYKAVVRRIQGDV